MFYYIYVLQSIDKDDLYVGYTTDLKKRLSEHNRKLNFSTKAYAPWRLIHFEAYLNQDDVKRRERYFKTNQGSRVIKRLLRNYFYIQKQKVEK